MATLIASGTSLQRALDVSIEQCRDRRLRESLRAVASDVDAGVALSDAMERRPLEFPEIVVAMVRAGELGGVLDDVLERSADLLERRDALRRQLVAVLAYPAFVLAAATLILGFVLIVTVPSFAAILQELHATLPLPTQALLALSEALHTPWVLALPVSFAIAAAGCMTAVNVPRIRRRVDRWGLSLPGFGTIRRQGNVASFARTVGVLIRCGVPLLATLDATRNVLRGDTFRDALATARSMLERGQPLSVGLAASGAFDDLCVQITAVGEESGSLDTALLRLAEHTERDIELTIRALSAMIEPALILILGAVVGGVVASILVPLYAAIGSVR